MRTTKLCTSHLTDIYHYILSQLLWNLQIYHDRTKTKAFMLAHTVLLGMNIKVLNISLAKRSYSVLTISPEEVAELSARPTVKRVAVSRALSCNIFMAKSERGK